MLCNWLDIISLAGFMIGVVSFIVTIVALVIAYRQWRGAKRMAIDFDMKRNTFVGFLHGMKFDKPLSQPSLEQVNDMLERFDYSPRGR
jgi:hypothetical protein